MEVVSDRWYRIDVARQVVWDALVDVDAYPTWWPWLDRFSAERLAPGETWCCTIRSPLRFSVSIDITFEDVAAPDRIAARVHGDVEGSASIAITDGGTSRTDLRLTSTLAGRSRPLDVVARVSPSLASWSHDRILDVGARQFREAVERRS